jgi:hypothetical protein
MAVKSGVGETDPLGNVAHCESSETILLYHLHAGIKDLLLASR